VVLGLVDYGMQRRRINKALMMTKQEVKEEMKHQEGSPEVKGAIRRRQVKMSRLRMMADVARADVVIVNPTHVAVALRYEAGHGAPKVVAKGADEVAAAIREEAERHDVPVVEDVPLARAIWQVCEIDDEIPADLFEAVARVLAFLYRVKASGVRPLGGGPLRVPVRL
jgi:flagellar biosynthesis protein FlhB